MSSTPSLEKVIQRAIDASIADVHTAIPGIVVEYDAATQKAKIQPAIKRKYLDGGLVSLPQLTNVPVVMPRAGKAIVHLLVKKDDVVLVVFSERSVDKWLSQGGVVDPLDARRHDLSDAFAIPGGYPFSDPATVSDPDALTVRNDQAEMKVLAGGKFSLKSLESSEELLDLLDQLIQAILDARTTTLLGTMPLVNPQFAVIKAKLATLKE